MIICGEMEKKRKEEITVGCSSYTVPPFVGWI
jgi:hypothetical protein